MYQIFFCKKKKNPANYLLRRKRQIEIWNWKKKKRGEEDYDDNNDEKAETNKTIKKKKNNKSWEQIVIRIIKQKKQN